MVKFSDNEINMIRWREYKLENDIKENIPIKPILFIQWLVDPIRFPELAVKWLRKKENSNANNRN